MKSPSDLPKETSPDAVAPLNRRIFLAAPWPRRPPRQPPVPWARTLQHPNATRSPT